MKRCYANRWVLSPSLSLHHFHFPMFTPRDRRGCDQSFPPPIIIKLRAKIVDRNAYARGQNSSGIHRIYPFFLFYSVHPLYDHRASRKPRETRRLALVYFILFSQELGERNERMLTSNRATTHRSFSCFYSYYAHEKSLRSIF